MVLFVFQYHSNSRCSLDLLNATLEQQREEFNNKEKELQEKLEKVRKWNDCL